MRITFIGFYLNVSSLESNLVMKRNYVIPSRNVNMRYLTDS